MKQTQTSYRIYYVLVIALALFSGINVFLPQGDLITNVPQELPASEPVLALVNAVVILLVYGGVGFAGMKLVDRLDFAPLWGGGVSWWRRIVLPALWGGILGGAFIVVDQVTAGFHQFGALPHPPFPTSLVASVSAAIGEEIIFRLFFITFWVWLIGHVLLKQRHQRVVFWIVAVFSGIAFAAGHLPSVMMLFGLREISAMPLVLIGEIFVLNTAISLVAAYYLRVAGVLAAILIHFWTDIVWHVIWGFFG